MSWSLRIGCGAGFSGDRIEPAVELVQKGRLDFLVFECLAERTIALAQQARARDPDQGYDPLLEARLRAVLPGCAALGVRIVTNMGAANPLAAAAKAAAIAQELGLSGLKIAAVTGDDVLALTRAIGPLAAAQVDAQAAGFELVSANAYLGCEPIVQALADGAQVVITGRVADPSLFLAPMIHGFGWALDDWPRLGRGTLVGHLLECAGQVTGGYFSDPQMKPIPDLARLGFPLAEVDADGDAAITKVEGSGGQVSVATCTEQLLYEIHDPASCPTPDVTADFSRVTFRQTRPDRVSVYGGSGAARPGQLKVSVGRREGFRGEGEMSYAGPGAAERARLAGEIVQARLALIGAEFSEVRADIIGVDAVGPARPGDGEVRLRVAAQAAAAGTAALVGQEVEALYTNGPAGGGGARRTVTPVLGVTNAFIPRSSVRPRIHVEVVP